MPKTGQTVTIAKIENALEGMYFVAGLLAVIGEMAVELKGANKLARAKWHVEDYVKKIAFLREPNPIGLSFAIRAVNRLKQMLSRRWHTIQRRLASMKSRTEAGTSSYST